MTALRKHEPAALPLICVDVVESGTRARRGWERCEIGTNLRFDTAKMESYFFATWEPVLFDALLVAAAVEFCDKTQRRPASGWGRTIALRIPVHEPDRWNRKAVLEALHGALNFLTGDQWDICFSGRKADEQAPRQGLFNLREDVSAVIPFSDGLDSCAVAGLMALKLGDKLVRVRLGSKEIDRAKDARPRQPFTSVPYKVRAGKRSFVESSARSRGFKFSLLSALAAYLAKAGRVIVPESGQGALGPVLAPVGQAYEDYRSHPLFTTRMEKFIAAVLGYQVRYDFPQLWLTKGETLARFVEKCEGSAGSWSSTWSCWQQNRHVGVEGRKRQCGICAACMLRRMSVHAAGLDEPADKYVWENLGASDFKTGAANSFDRKKITGAMREYAIAGALHLDHLATIRHSPANAKAIALNAFQLAQVCGLSEGDVRANLDRMLVTHASEWRSFVASLGANSFVAGWAACEQ